MTTCPQWQKVHTLLRICYRQYFVRLKPVKDLTTAAPVVVRAGPAVLPDQAGRGYPPRARFSTVGNCNGPVFDSDNAGVS